MDRFAGGRRMLAALLLLTPLAWAGPARLDERLRVLDQASLRQPMAERVSQLQHAYAADPLTAAMIDGCADVPADRLDEAFEATVLVNFYAKQPLLLQRLRCLLPRLRASGAATPEQLKAVHRAMIAQRQFAQANALRASEGLDVALMPQLQGAVSPQRQVLMLADAGHAQRQDLPQQGWRVLAIVHPYCGFSMRALAAISTEPAWAWLRPHLQLVVPNDQSWPIGPMLEWNQAHPQLPLQPLQPGPAWASLSTGETPTFHLLHDGDLVTTITGWENDGQALAELQERLQATH